MILFLHGDVVKGDLVVGIIRQVTWGEGKSKIAIEDDDKDIHDILITSSILSQFEGDLVGTHVIYAKCDTTILAENPPFHRVYEILHLIEERRTLEYKFDSK